MQVASSHHAQAGFGRRQHGATLVISLLLLVLLGLGAAAAVRSSLSSQQATDNFQRELMAHQYAEMGLRYCESQMLLTSASRMDQPLRDIDSTATVKVPLWGDPATWISTNIVTVPAGWVANADNSTFTGVTLPQCLVEKIELPQGGDALLVTARGFSPGYSADSNGRTVSGSVVWLQSTVIIQ